MVHGLRSPDRGLFPMRAESRAGQKFCAECGLALAAACPNCSTSVRRQPEVLSRVRLRACRPTDRVPRSEDTRPARDSLAVGRAALRHHPVRRPGRLHAALRGAGSRRGSRSPDALFRRRARGDRAATAAASRSSSATPSWRCGARRWRRRTTPSARCAPRSSSSTGERAEHRRPAAARSRAGVLSGEAAVTLGRDRPGNDRRRIVNTASRLQSVAPARHRARRRGHAYSATSAAIAYESGRRAAAQGQVGTGRGVARAAGRGRASAARRASEGSEPPFVGRDEELRLLKEQSRRRSESGSCAS